jgi:hypothetical protein
VGVLGRYVGVCGLGVCWVCGCGRWLVGCGITLMGACDLNGWMGSVYWVAVFGECVGWVCGFNWWRG